jgi:hypothetical protein
MAMPPCANPFTPPSSLRPSIHIGLNRQTISRQSADNQQTISRQSAGNQQTISKSWPADAQSWPAEGRSGPAQEGRNPGAQGAWPGGFQPRRGNAAIKAAFA